MSKKGIIAVAAAIAVATAAYLYWKSKQATGSGGLTKLQQAQYLVNSNYATGTPATIVTFGDGYVAAWYTGAVAGQQTFTYQGKTYSTMGGEAA